MHKYCGMCKIAKKYRLYRIAKTVGVLRALDMIKGKK